MCRLLALVILLTAYKATAQSQDPPMDEWQKSSTKDHVDVYTKNFPGTNIIAVRGIGTIFASAKEVWDVMVDNTRSREWLPMILKKETLKQLTPDSRIEYSQVRMPWPLTDRYTLAVGTVQKLPGDVFKVQYESAKDFPFSDPDRIEAKLFLSTFYLRPEAPDRTHIDIAILSDPQGSVPKIFVNFFQKTWPVRFINGLRGQVDKVQSERQAQKSEMGPAVTH